MEKRNCPKCGATIPAHKPDCFRCKLAAGVVTHTPKPKPATKANKESKK